jgi:hypothetical protein
MDRTRDGNVTPSYTLNIEAASRRRISQRERKQK